MILADVKAELMDFDLLHGPQDIVDEYGHFNPEDGGEATGRTPDLCTGYRIRWAYHLHAKRRLRSSSCSATRIGHPGRFVARRRRSLLLAAGVPEHSGRRVLMRASRSSFTPKLSAGRAHLASPPEIVSSGIKNRVGLDFYMIQPSFRRAEEFMDGIEHNLLADAHRPPIFQRLLDTQRADLRALQKPTHFLILHLAWRQLQRTWLQIIAYVDFRSGARLENRIGAFVYDEANAAHLTTHGIPVWVHLPAPEAHALGVIIDHWESAQSPLLMGINTIESMGAPRMGIQPQCDTASVMAVIGAPTARLFGIRFACPGLLKRTRGSSEVQSY